MFCRSCARPLHITATRSERKGLRCRIRSNCSISFGVIRRLGFGGFIGDPAVAPVETTAIRFFGKRRDFSKLDGVDDDETNCEFELLESIFELVAMLQISGSVMQIWSSHESSLDEEDGILTECAKLCKTRSVGCLTRRLVRRDIVNSNILTTSNNKLSLKNIYSSSSSYFFSNNDFRTN